MICSSDSTASSSESEHPTVSRILRHNRSRWGGQTSYLAIMHETRRATGSSSRGESVCSQVGKLGWEPKGRKRKRQNFDSVGGCLAIHVSSHAAFRLTLDVTVEAIEHFGRFNSTRSIDIPKSCTDQLLEMLGPGEPEQRSRPAGMSPLLQVSNQLRVSGTRDRQVSKKKDRRVAATVV